MEQEFQIRQKSAEKIIEHALKRERIFYVYDVIEVLQDAGKLWKIWFNNYKEKMLGGFSIKEKSNAESQLESYYYKASPKVSALWVGKMRKYRV